MMHKKCDWAKISIENGHFIFAFLVGVGDKFKILLDLHKERHMEAFLGAKCASVSKLSNIFITPFDLLSTVKIPIRGIGA